MKKKSDTLRDYLLQYPNGRMISTFDTDAEAKVFADGMRQNIGDSYIATVELSYNRVTVQLSTEALVSK